MKWYSWRKALNNYKSQNESLIPIYNVAEGITISRRENVCEVRTRTLDKKLTQNPQIAALLHDDSLNEFSLPEDIDPEIQSLLEAYDRGEDPSHTTKPREPLPILRGGEAPRAPKAPKPPHPRQEEMNEVMKTSPELMRVYQDTGRDYEVMEKYFNENNLWPKEISLIIKPPRNA